MANLVCTLAVFTRTLSGVPLVVAANRDEFYARPATAPVDLSRPEAAGGDPCQPSEPVEPPDRPRVFGGRDLVAGGSWLVINQRSVVVGVLNRRTEAAPDPSLRSRGLLCLDLARASSADEAAACLERVDPRMYNPFNILVADLSRAYVAQNRAARVHVQELPPGAHVLTNLDLNDPTCPRGSRATRLALKIERQLRARRDDSRLVSELGVLLSDHVVDEGDPLPLSQLCIHTALYGTRSSSVILLPELEAPQVYFADGPPCQVPHRRLPLPWE